MPRLNWKELTREELGIVLHEAIVVLPTAATEQHGPHLTTGHDTFTVTEVAHRAADRVGESSTVIVTPVLQFGSSDHHLPFGGTLSLRSETYLLVVQDLLRSMITSGAKKVLVLNGHGGNHELNEVAIRDVSREQEETAGISLAAASYWTIAARALAESGDFTGARVPGHAGQFETAMMLAIEPQRVREPLPERLDDPSVGTIIPGVRIEGEVSWKSFDGFTDSPARALMESGQRALEIVVEEVAQAIQRFGGMVPLRD